MKPERKAYKIGVDAGSTTLKLVLLDDGGEIVRKSYQRHNADVEGVFKAQLGEILGEFPGATFSLCLTGSAGMGLAERFSAPFVQEVVASVDAAKKLYPQAGAIIDLGGEDAKMVFMDAGRTPDIRMNGSCAGGTGAFIDQMADLMNLTPARLGELAARHEKIHPVASRCGVFAKTDVQNLICAGARAEDIAMSVLYAVALQTLTTLSRGRDILPGLLCIGGPLTFIPALREAFAKALKLSASDFIVPENGEFFPALGCAAGASAKGCDLRAMLSPTRSAAPESVGGLPALFSDAREYESWRLQRRVKPLQRARLGAEKNLRCYLGVDSGSTTTKLLVLDSEGALVYDFYSPNFGDPLGCALKGLRGFYEKAAAAGVDFEFLGSCSTGYGEGLLKSAFGLDFGIVETMAHLGGAQYVDPEVSFVLDIGGQDMKSIFANGGAISNIELNEACSSGCGSFLQNFASVMGAGLEDFSRSACLAKNPSDLGSRCTVFMNSKVKQSLREGATLGDIAAGLAYSVVKNCLFKVLKIDSLERLGESIVVQGGTFRNDAVFRALELLSGKKVGSTDAPELMGALGAALYAKRAHEGGSFKTRFSGRAPLPDFSKTASKNFVCAGCPNRCSVQRFSFENGGVSFAGNKCEKTLRAEEPSAKRGRDCFALKNGLLFAPSAKPAADGARVRIGIPRALNMFENFPFWRALFEGCGFEAVLSPESTAKLYRKGLSCVMSDNICFPAKLVQGHVFALAQMGVQRIFYPMVQKEAKHYKAACNSFNCPVVSGYPDVIRSAVDPQEKFSIPLDKPVVSFHDGRELERACKNYFTGLGVDEKTFSGAFAFALAESERVARELRDGQRALLDEAVKSGESVFVVAGRPYHADLLVNQKVGQILSDLGALVLTDDVFGPARGGGFEELFIVSQWSYPNRVVHCAMEVAKLPHNVQMVQLNSFGCGPDSFFMEEIRGVLKRAGKNLTILRIDEISSPGSVRLRLRSLMESLKLSAPPAQTSRGGTRGTAFRKSDRDKTIIVPWFADFISPFFPALAGLAGYRMENLPKPSDESAQLGLKYGHNEVCYPSTLVLGDIIMGLRSGRYDPDNVAVGITQTGGQCRATNYISQIKSGMQSAGFGRVPLIAVSGGAAIQNDQRGLKIPVLKLMNIGVYALLYGDSLWQMLSACSAREKSAGAARKIFDFYMERGVQAVRANDHRLLLRLLSSAVENFNMADTHGGRLEKIGLVGEIYVKYNSYAQAEISDWMRARGMEVLTPPAIDFLMQYFVNADVNIGNGIERDSLLRRALRGMFRRYMEERIARVEDIARKFRFHRPNESVWAKARRAEEILDLSNQFGEGWLIAAEAACYARAGVNRVVCVQPFGCIANHIIAKGVETRLKKIYPDLSMLYLDLDGGAAKVNLQNRLHFMTG